MRCTIAINNFCRNSKRWNAQQQPTTSKAQKDEPSVATNNLKQCMSSKKWNAQQQPTMLKAQKGEVHSKEEDDGNFLSFCLFGMNGQKK